MLSQRINVPGRRFVIDPYPNPNPNSNPNYNPNPNPNPKPKLNPKLSPKLNLIVINLIRCAVQTKMNPCRVEIHMISFILRTVSV